MIALRRIDHVCLRVADVAEASSRWSIQFGLTECEAERAGLEAPGKGLPPADDASLTERGC